jgi:hypothetical protein
VKILADDYRIVKEQLYRVSKKNAMEIQQAVMHHKRAWLNNSIFT